MRLEASPPRFSTSSRGDRADANGGGEEGIFRWSRMRLRTGGSVRKAMTTMDVAKQ